MNLPVGVWLTIRAVRLKQLSEHECRKSPLRGLAGLRNGMVLSGGFVTEDIMLLKHGTPMAYRVCEACNHLARGLSIRNWCPACEFECTAIGQRVREKLKQLAETPEPPTNDLSGSTAPAFQETPPGSCRAV